MENSCKLRNAKPHDQQLNVAVLLLQQWTYRYKTRKQLHELFLNDPGRVLNDLGLNADEVRAEYQKPFWR